MKNKKKIQGEERDKTKLCESERGGEISKTTKHRAKCNLYKTSPRTLYGNALLDNWKFVVTRYIYIYIYIYHDIRS